MEQDKQFNSMRYANDFTMDSIDQVRLSKVMSMLSDSNSVLDVGCGDGFIMEKFRGNGKIVEGVEIAELAIEKARKKGFVVYNESLNGSWSQKIERRYDAVFLGEIIEHIFDTDLFLDEVVKVLKPKGILVVTTPNIASLGRRLLLFLGKNPLIENTARSCDAGHIRYFTINALCSLLKEHNFNIVEKSSVTINFDAKGKISSKFLASLFPSFGNTIIVKAMKKTEV